MFWLWILLSVGLIVGLSVWIGSMLNTRARNRAGVSNDRRAQMTALKASGALPGRKIGR